MAAIRKMRTMLGGYEVFNLTGAELATLLMDEDLSNQPDGSRVTFSLSAPFVAGTLRVWWKGVRQSVGVSGWAVPDAAAGQFTVDVSAVPAPATLDLLQVFAIKA